MDREHQQNKPNKGHSEKTEFNERGLWRERTALKDKHIQEINPQATIQPVKTCIEFSNNQNDNSNK